MLGVERVTIACTADSSLTAAEVQAVCAQLVKKAQSTTALPVAVATAADLEPANFTLPSERLLLSVALSARDVGDQRRALSINVTSGRRAGDIRRNQPVKSEAQLNRIGGQLVIQGPVDAFAKLLGSKPLKLHRPIRSDS